MVKLIRRCDYVARYGGEEFALILVETDKQGAAVLAEKLRAEIDNLKINANGRTVKVTISAGVASCSPKSDHFDKTQLIAAADKALYFSKRKGRNQVTLA
jgi:diguanylate cyclase (GGDEF)-like protein